MDKGSDLQHSFRKKESKTTESILALAEENKQLKAEIKAISKANALLRKENTFLEEANALTLSAIIDKINFYCTRSHSYLGYFSPASF